MITFGTFIAIFLAFTTALITLLYLPFRVLTTISTNLKLSPALLTSTNKHTTASTVPTKEAQKEIRDEFLRERFFLRDRRAKTQDEIDKQLLLLSSGALTLSITFIRFVIPNPMTSTLVWLGLSWLAFGMTIVGILTSFRLSEANFCNVLRANDYEYRTDEDFDRSSIKRLDMYIKLSNDIALAAFFAGFCLQAVFFFGNIGNPDAVSHGGASNVRQSKEAQAPK